MWKHVVIISAIFLMGFVIFADALVKEFDRVALLTQDQIFLAPNGFSSLMILTSPAFRHNETIPPRFTCDGDNINPALNIQNVPAGAKSLALIVDDPDAPNGTFVHWIVFNIEPTTSAIEENTNPGVLGITSFGKEGYGGPCPPSGAHRYFFKLYALDTRLDELTQKPTSKAEIESRMEGHILDTAELIGVYERKNF